ncbi:hypothetical protein [Agrobacterium tumefaciens]|uniref:hypothetical protein n=1 Tax=Agrobacterium tumefaciens TaxID=358 RepID=UPI0008100D27|nr:hypothetical protein [Agrobacterium tumefaciens]NSL21723.1 hypothetical protein [Agrobacterium tumefaciens]NTC58253.1 hypothetical protein [Agrobacterium tumefaciens]NTC60243.1 hypothetical protein [Agrobacterium tumefaciens]NTC66744.1 hypothetical protein [Agrobacterium tumefaciens]NTC71090.1 hypothetical protein [Agrobacterium tumefaciens]
MENGSPEIQNAEPLAREFVKSDPRSLNIVLFNHASNDWRDVISRKIDVQTAIFTGENSNKTPSQKVDAVKNCRVRTARLLEEEGDPFLAFKNPTKFTNNLTSFLER